MKTAGLQALQNVPDNPDVRKRYLFYLHGLIIEEAGIRPKSEEHGYYEYQRIVDALAWEGFTVISEAREQGTKVRPYAEKVATQINHLLEKKVPAQNITVVGASKGGIIGAYVSTMLRIKEINYVFLAGLFEKCLQDERLVLYGKVLSIHDQADKLPITPEMYFQRSKGAGQFKAMVLDLGVGHGLIYKPYREWIEPLLDWVTGDKQS